MRILTKHKELIERDANDISILWKLLQMLFYCVSAIAGYVTAHAFFMFQDLVNGTTLARQADSQLQHSTSLLYDTDNIDSFVYLWYCWLFFLFHMWARRLPSWNILQSLETGWTGYTFQLMSDVANLAVGLQFPRGIPSFSIPSQWDAKSIWE
ncbi:uncharacterized protein [Neodiprion pinetum]|uniref:Uncharacterized protein LOC107223528 isoform X2 n=1 Tax=Neodiprion lecontei TaxID=441921 RepID=A0ABM3GMZ8_NEOLC|nr:uncharacterized protein LOC124223818 isoform X2 [Neodiprion pinetum]XP_046601650.1 uncharacterized protein LOC107223528 isoform X2 [Neodiprion lecontei]